MTQTPAARVTDPVAHTMALPGALIGLVAGAAIGALAVATVATGGAALAIAMSVGGAVALSGGLGMAGAYIGEAIPGPPTGAIVVGSPNVITEGLPQSMVIIGQGTCALEFGVPQPVATGAMTVLINGMPAARVGEKLTCSAVIIKGANTVLIGGASGQMLPMQPEVPSWLSATMLAMTIGGSAVAFGAGAKIFGLAATVGTFIGGMVGGHYSALGGRALGEYLGLSEPWLRVSEVGGGALGGGMAARRLYPSSHSLRTLPKNSPVRREAANNIRNARTALRSERPDLNARQRNKIIEAFDPKDLKVHRLEKPEAEYRRYGDSTIPGGEGAKKIGSWTSTDRFKNTEKARNRLALIDNKADKEAIIGRPAGSLVLKGTVAPQKLPDGRILPGGAKQTYTIDRYAGGKLGQDGKFVGGQLERTPVRAVIPKR